jgi:hypothetical protein
MSPAFRGGNSWGARGIISMSRARAAPFIEDKMRMGVYATVEF